MKTKQVLVKVQVEILVEVQESISLDDAEEIALFNVEPIIPSISSDLNKMMNDIEIYTYDVISTKELED